LPGKSADLACEKCLIGVTRLDREPGERGMVGGQQAQELLEAQDAKMARPAGFEPATYRLEGGCSIP
jgi:hypothetical protein